VLTAIGLVNGNPAFLTPHRIYRSLKNLSQVIKSTTSTAVQNLVEIHTWRASGQIGEISPSFFLLIPPFKQLTYRSNHLPHFMLNGSNDTDSSKGVPFLSFVDIAPHLGDQIAQKRPFLGRE